MLSIIITHHKTPELLDLCLKSIKEGIGDINHEIIIVDSESTEETREFIQEKYSDIKIISFEKNLGYSKIINKGLLNVKGDYILILNADIIVLKDAISKMLKFIEKNPSIGILAPQLLDFAGNIQISCFAKPTLKTILARRTFFGKLKQGKEALNKFLISDWDRKSIREVDWVQGSAMMVKKEAIKKVGLWDERFFMYFEDTDWCRRFWEKGYKVVYYPLAQMSHYYHRSSKKWGGILDIFLNKYTRTHIISALKYFLKYHG
ncbi:MAG: glycosyltransferase family 2 protein [Patescibacteria group bacterium]